MSLLQVAGVGQLQRRQTRDVNLQHRQVGQLVDAHQLGFDGPVRRGQLSRLLLVQSLQAHSDLSGALDDVSVGNDQPVRRQQHAGANATLRFQVGGFGLVVLAAQAEAGGQHLHYRLRDLAGELLDGLAEDMQWVALEQLGGFGGAGRLLGLGRARNWRET